MMGYRSNVAYRIRMKPLNNETDDEVKAKFKQFIAECKVDSDTQRAMQEFDTYDEKWRSEGTVLEINYDECEIFLEYQHVKWYPDYDDVKSHHAIISKAHDWNNTEENYRFDTAFGRIGEEQDDIEIDYEGDGYELIQLETSFYFG